MAGYPSQVRYDTLAALKVSLQKALGRAQPAAAPKLSFAWLRAPSSDWQLLLAFEGADAVLRLADGRHYVGKVVRRSKRSLLLELWGCGGRLQRFAVADVRGAAVVGPHGYREEVEVMRRQRRGEPAYIGEPMTRR